MFRPIGNHQKHPPSFDTNGRDVEGRDVVERPGGRVWGGARFYHRLRTREPAAKEKYRMLIRPKST